MFAVKENCTARRAAAWLAAVAMSLALLGAAPSRALAAEAAAPLAAGAAATAETAAPAAGEAAAAVPEAAPAAGEAAAAVPEAAPAAGADAPEAGDAGAAAAAFPAGEAPLGGLWELQPGEVQDASAMPAEDAAQGLLQLFAAPMETGFLYDGLTEAQKAVYRACDSAFNNLQPDGDGKLPIAAIDESYGLRKDDLLLPVTAYLYDHPEVFWLGGGYTPWAYLDTGIVVGIQLNKKTVSAADNQAKDAQLAAFTAAADAVLAKVDAAAPPAVVALRVQDALAQRVTYDYPALTNKDYLPHTAYGALVNGKAVCDGYAKAYAYLLGRCGITASVVVSTPFNHAWNLVRL